MDRCPDQPGWSAYFKENMDGLGMPTPESFYSRAVAAFGTWKAYASLVEHFGTKVTVRELFVAGARRDVEVFAGAFIASIYVGGVIGSAAVATGPGILGRRAYGHLLRSKT